MTADEYLDRQSLFTLRKLARVWTKPKEPRGGKPRSRKVRLGEDTMKVPRRAAEVKAGVAALAERTAIGQLRILWPRIMRENRRHLIDEPGIHLDQGTFANQLRYHDSEGDLSGTLVLYHEAEHERKPVEYEWDHYGDEDEQPGRIWIVVDPKRLRRGIAKALLTAAVIRHNWPINFDKQRKTLAGAILIRKFLESLHT